VKRMLARHFYRQLRTIRPAALVEAAP
jgi:hypothetical protein